MTKMTRETFSFRVQETTILWGVLYCCNPVRDWISRGDVCEADRKTLRPTRVDTLVQLILCVLGLIVMPIMLQQVATAWVMFSC